jgi:hypothetical protein
MAQENILLQQPNFCIAPLVGTFASVDTTQTSARLLIKNTTGDTTVSYTFNPNIAQNTTIYYLDYIGPRNQTSLENGMVFITMESNLTSSVTIKKWNLNKDNTRLDLDYTINKITSGNEIIKCHNMAAGRYYTNLTNTTVTGTATIVLDNVDNIVEGTRIYVGPSSNTSYLNAYEEVEAVSVSGTTVSISSPSGTPLFSYFNSGDPVTYLGDFYIFSDVAYGNNTSKGSLITIDNYTGATLDRHNSAIYSDVAASNYGIPYYGTVALVKKSELLYIDVADYSRVRSVRLNVTRPSSQDLLEVYALAFTSAAVYRLQNQKIIRDDTGAYSIISWSTYNYHEDGVFRFVDCITLETNPIGIIANQETINIQGQVTDQYGMAVSGKTIQFDKQYGDANGVWGEVNRQATSDINGRFSIPYTSGWYDQSEASDINEDIKITAWTDGSNILTGSIYVWTSLVFKLNAKFIMGPDTTPYYGASIIKQVDNIFDSSNNLSQIPQFTSQFYIVAKNYLEIRVPLIYQWQKFESILGIVQEELQTSDFVLTQIELATGTFPVSQTYISRHLPTGSNEDDVEIAQFRFIIDAVPVPFSEKNNVNANIWIKLAPYGFDLDRSTLVFKVKEISYVGNTGFINYQNTANLTVTEYDAGGGLIGLEVLYVPDEYFHNSAIVYVYLEVYDNAIPPNRIEFDYWFTIIPDYKAPYITNEAPYRGQLNVPVTSDISFDILDTEVGVDIGTLELFINNRIKPFTYEELDKGYRITFHNTGGFYYTQIVEMSIRVADSSERGNVLYDMWRFYCASSVAPIIDGESFDPKTCIRGYNTRTTGESFDVYDGGGGLDPDSIELIVDGIIKPIKLLPIIKRIL